MIIANSYKLFFHIDLKLNGSKLFIYTNRIITIHGIFFSLKQQSFHYQSIRRIYDGSYYWQPDLSYNNGCWWMLTDAKRQQDININKWIITQYGSPILLLLHDFDLSNTRGWFNIKMPFYQYRKSHFEDKMIVNILQRHFTHSEC